MVSHPAIPSTDHTSALPSLLTIACPARQVKAYRINGFTHALEWLPPKGGQVEWGNEVLGYPQCRALLTQHEKRGVGSQTCIDLVEPVALFKAIASEVEENVPGVFSHGLLHDPFA